jgi:hypothetical protein
MEKIPEEQRAVLQYVTLDLSESMNGICVVASRRLHVLLKG